MGKDASEPLELTGRRRTLFGVALGVGSAFLAACSPDVSQTPTCQLYKNPKTHYLTPDVLTGNQIPHVYPLGDAQVTVGYNALGSTTDTADATVQQNAQGEYVVTPHWRYVTAPNPLIADLSPVNAKGFLSFAADITFATSPGAGITDVGVSRACFNSASGYLDSITLPHS